MLEADLRKYMIDLNLGCVWYRALGFQHTVCDAASQKSYPSLLYECKTWILKQRDVRRLKTAEMKFMRRTTGYSLLDHRRNEDIFEELKAEPVEKKLAQCKQK
jgi:hypothetical protein